MARKEMTFVVEAEGRDKGKHFFIREMSASQAEEWAMRALMALAKAGVEMPDEMANAGLAGIASAGFQALGRMQFSDAKPLLDEMMACVQIVPDPAKPMVRRALIEDDIEEILTRLRLRKEVFELLTGFSLAAAQ